MERLRFWLNSTHERCGCGALPGLYHGQLCGDQNTMAKPREADRDQVVSLYDKDQKFQGFAILPEGQWVRSRVADNAWTVPREAALNRFVERLEAAAAEVVEGPISAYTANNTPFTKYGFHGAEQEGMIPFLVKAQELDAVIDGYLDCLADHLTGKMTAPTRLVWRKRPELRSDGPVMDAEAVRYGVSPRDHAVIWLYMRLALEPVGFV